jgi:CRISPR-associated protein Csm4
MTKFNIYKLRFTTPLHIGNERADYGTSLQTIHSDTLYAAMTSVLAKIGRDIPSDGDLGFTISSLYPYYQKEKGSNPVYFLPKLKSQTIPARGLQNVAKKIKKIEWLDIDFFNKQINGNELFSNNFNIELLENGKYLTSKKIDKKFLTKEVNPRVQVPRDYGVVKDAEPFYMERIYFKDFSGLYLIADGDTSVLDIALEILQNEGIGTDRTIGNGFFEYSKDVLELELPESDCVMNLSLFIPENQEQIDVMINKEGEKVAYDFQKRGGWITDAGLNTFRKNTVYMFSEASVFANDSSVYSMKIKGKIVDLKPQLDYGHIGVKEHPIWRNGKSLFIPVKLS